MKRRLFLASSALLFAGCVHNREGEAEVEGGVVRLSKVVVGEDRKQDPPVTDSDSEALDDARLLHEAFEEADGTVDEVLEQERRERGENFEGVVEIVEKETDSAERYLETEEAVEEMPVYEEVFPEDEERGEGFPGRYVRHEGRVYLVSTSPRPTELLEDEPT